MKRCIVVAPVATVAAAVAAVLSVAACGVEDPLKGIPIGGPLVGNSADPLDDGAGDPLPNDCGFAPAQFTFPTDELACDGDQFVKHDDTYNLFVGVTLCSSSADLRIYLSDAGDNFFPATDWAGNGQDHCELVNPEFTINNEDDITSGGCSSCSAGVNLPLEHVPVWERGQFGDPFDFNPSSPEWADQTSRLNCGYDVATCTAR